MAKVSKGGAGAVDPGNNSTRRPPAPPRHERENLVSQHRCEQPCPDEVTVGYSEVSSGTQTHHVVEPLASGQWRHDRVAAHTFTGSPSGGIRSIRATALRISGAYATISRSRTAREVVTTSEPACEYLRYIDDTGTIARCAWAAETRRTDSSADLEAPFLMPGTPTPGPAADLPYRAHLDIGVGDFHDATMYDPRLARGVAGRLATISSKLTVNRGLRYDLSVNASGNEYDISAVHELRRPNDANNVQPRAGFAWRLNDGRSCVAASGLYFSRPAICGNFGWRRSTVSCDPAHQRRRPNFAADPFNGQPVPHSSSAAALLHVRNVPGCCAVPSRTDGPASTHGPGTHLADSIGVQRQVGARGIRDGYVYSQGRHEKDVIDNVNLTSTRRPARLPVFGHHQAGVPRVRPDLSDCADGMVQLPTRCRPVSQAD